MACLECRLHILQDSFVECAYGLLECRFHTLHDSVPETSDTNATPDDIGNKTLSLRKRHILPLLMITQEITL